jgi:hypothetical protein
VFSRDFDFEATAFVGDHSGRDAIDGFAAIASALDRGIDSTDRPSGRITDVLAIGVGWLVLAAVIFYPASQLAAIALCAAFFCLRSFARFVFGSDVARHKQSPDGRGPLPAI